MAVMLKEGGQHMQWYQDELLHMAKDIGLRLLPAFNTSSGLPYPRVRHTEIPQFSPSAQPFSPTVHCLASALVLLSAFPNWMRVDHHLP